MSDTETGSDETTELAAPPQVTYAPDLYLVVVSTIAGALLALMGVLLFHDGSSTGETPCTHPTEAAAAEAPGPPKSAAASARMRLLVRSRTTGDQAKESELSLP
jgi:hypothetical protein